MSQTAREQTAREHARVAALVRHGSDPAVLAEARTALAEANVRTAVNAQRAALGLPALPDDLAGVVTHVAFLGDLGAALEHREAA
jgi:hypothetical protein